jgi:hypothetical protein
MRLDAALLDVLNRVAGGEACTGALADADKVHDLLESSRSELPHEAAGLSAARADELVRDIRAGRRRR